MLQAGLGEGDVLSTRLTPIDCIGLQWCRPGRALWGLGRVRRPTKRV